MFDNPTIHSKRLVEAGLALIALVIVLQVIFGGSVSFVGGDVVDTITTIVGGLGAQSLVGSATIIEYII